jgi:carboxylesterase
MTQHAHLDPSPFQLDGGSIGALLIHGFTGAPPEMRPLGEALHEDGITVLAPLLPGHGTRVEEMNPIPWERWTDHVEAALAWLQQRCDTVFVGGLSMGGLLALHLGIHSPRIAGLLLYAPALTTRDRLLPMAGLAKRFLATRPKGPKNLVDPSADQRIWSYERNPVGAAQQLWRGQRLIRPRLGEIVCPTLVFHSTLDTVVPIGSSQAVLDGLGSDEKRLVTLTGSGHCLTVDAEWERVARQSRAFIQGVLGNAA